LFSTAFFLELLLGLLLLLLLGVRLVLHRTLRRVPVGLPPQRRKNLG
jgi:hypothetical protein